ncbi:hypothetical protein L873DRAFT_974460 [Choiromyces venosus 120613-1]|uniref:Fungal-specific transcription factor domain-containing protein n=1 Tax=Choiromyces venosus 120613-1 TaxID=1336337 RepID=A0A3N4JPX5_9PEZI|nr:hypothetical protein L873DRAFT_974460 [Choiromyces venosus 120613-1]
MPSSTTTNTLFELGSPGYASPTNTAATLTSGKEEMRSSPESVGPAPTKPKQSKSRNGQKRGVPCGGYKKDFKWRPFEEASLAGKAPKPARPGAPKPKRSSPPFPSLDISLTTSVSGSIGAPQPSPPESSFGSPPAHQSQYGPSQNSPYMHKQHSSVSSNSFDFDTAFLSPLDSPGHLTPPPAQAQSGPLGQQHTGAFTITSPPDLTPVSPDDRSSMFSIPPEFDDNTPADIASSLAPTNGLVPITSAPMQGFIDVPSFGYPGSHYSPAADLQNTIPAIVKEEPEEDGDIEEVIRSGQNSQSDWTFTVLSPTSANSPRARSSRGGAFVSINDIFRRPAVTATSQEMLVLHFDKHTCGIMSVKDGPNENPWRTLIWPLAGDSPALYHAIASMTAFHMSEGRPELRVEGMEHMRKSIRCLAEDISSGDTRNEAALATTLVLAFSEAFDRHTSTGIEHLRGAKILVKQALAKHNTSSPDVIAYKRLGFLYNVWVYLDVLARLTSDEDDDGQGPEFMVNRPLTPMSEIDPLLGCAATLFPLIGRVASLVQKVRKTDQNTYAIISEAMEIKDLLESWAPEASYDPPVDSSSSVLHCLKTAEAYRFATLLYLHQAVPELQSPSSRELAQQVMCLIAEIPMSSRSCIVHIYPLLAAGCEAITEGERSWVKSRWEDMCSRMWIGNVSKAWEVMKEVWDRRDRFWETQEAIQGYSSLSPTGTQFGSPPLDAPGYKRKTSPVEPEIEEVYGWGGVATLNGNNDIGPKRLAMTDGSSGRPSVRSVESGCTPPDMLGEREMSVRGKLHWVGVMKDWEWEGEYLEQKHPSGFFAHS